MICFFFVLSQSNSPLNRLYITKNRHFSGDWEYGGESKLTNDEIYLIGKTPNTTGFVWSLNKTTHPRWSADASLSFADESKNSQFGLWLTTHFNVTGPIFGGPGIFYGVALLGLFNGSHINIELIENDQKEHFNKTDFAPTFSQYIVNKTINIRIDKTNQSLKIELIHDDNSTIIFNDKMRVKLDKGNFAITGQNDDIPSPIILNSVFMNGEQSKEKIKDVNKSVETSEYLKKYSSPTIDNILNIFDYVNQKIYKVSDVDDLSSIILEAFLPFSDRWQRRSIKLQKSTSSLKSKIFQELNVTSHILTGFKDQLDQDFIDLKHEIQEVQSELYFGVYDNYKMNRNLKDTKKEIKKGGISRVLMFIIMIEVFGAFLFLVYVQLFNKPNL